MHDHLQWSAPRGVPAPRGRFSSLGGRFPRIWRKNWPQIAKIRPIRPSPSPPPRVTSAPPRKEWRAVAGGVGGRKEVSLEPRGEVPSSRRRCGGVARRMEWADAAPLFSRAPEPWRQRWRGRCDRAATIADGSPSRGRWVTAPASKPPAVVVARQKRGVAGRESNPSLGSYPMRRHCANGHVSVRERRGGRWGARGAAPV